MYHWCEENQSAVDTLVQILKQDATKSVWFSSFISHIPSETAITTHKTELQEFISPCSVQKMDTAVIPNESEVLNKATSLYVELTVSNRKRRTSDCESDNELILPSEKKLKTDGYECSSNMSLQQDLKITELSYDSSTSKKDAISLPDQEVVLAGATLETAMKIKEAWISEQRISQAEAAVFTCTTEEMTELCRVIGVSDLTETSLTVACDSLITHSSSLSFANSQCFFEKALLPRLIGLSKPASRVLFDVLFHVTLNFPQQMIEGVLMYSMEQCQTNERLHELILKLVKSELPYEVRKLFLAKALASGINRANESSLLIVHTLLEYNMTLENNDIVHLMLIIENNARVLQSSLKYGKFLMSVITKYKKQLTQSHISTLRLIIESHKTFLKKSLLTALNKN